jgi:hypothetical protein
MMLPACSSDSCFVSGTMIETPDGPKPIESLEIGNIVWSFSLETGQKVARRVKATLRSWAREVRAIRAGGRLIGGVTTEHPFFDPVRTEYRPVRELEAGDVLAIADERGLRRCAIESIAATEVAGPQIEVFNLTIDGPESNYFAEGILVHNKEPVEPLCPADTVTISPHADLDASAPGAETQGDFDVTLTVPSDQTTFSILIVRDRADRAKPDQVVEKASEKLYRARLVQPSPGSYEIIATGFLTVGGTNCQLPDLSRKFIVAESTADAGAD